MDDKLDSIFAALESVQLSQTGLHHDMGRLREHVSAEIDKARTDLQADLLATRTDLQADLIAIRTQIMERLDRQQAKLESMFNDIAVNWHNSERVERKVDSDRDEIRSLAKMVSELTRMVRAFESRLSIVEEKP